jgi:DmsE family decaheme c-type cytochrome
LVGVPLGSGQEQKPAEAKPAAEEPAEAPAGPATYVGSEACQVCHEDVYTAFLKNPHILVETGKKRGWEKKACESCHGPGSKHAESASAADIINPAKQHPADADRTCLTCHRNQPTQVGRVQSGHGRNQVSCVSCHSIHKGREEMVPRRARAVNEQCGACHTAVWSQFQRPHKHPLPEGAMSCTDCHNPHGSLLPRSVRTVMGNEPGCIKCHGDKRGPFTFEHAPVKLEGCSTCHEPHGSANPRMLTRHEVRNVCLECHANLPVPNRQTMGVVPPAFHDLRSPRFRNCTICHQKIHGSHVDRMFLR